MRVPTIDWRVVGLIALLLTGMPCAAGEDLIREAPPDLPDVTVLDQHGVSRRFYSDLVQGRTVVISFIFTKCTMICSSMTLQLRNAQRSLPDGPARATEFISVSVDPQNDTPQDLLAFAKRMDARHRWTFITGQPQAIAQLLRAFRVPLGTPTAHQAVVVLGNDRTRVWTRRFGPPDPALLATLIGTVARTDGLMPTGASADEAAHYFTNLPLQTQDGRTVRFYQDLLAGQLVVISTMFTECTMLCPQLTHTLRDAQRRLTAVGLDRVRMISISVDPEHDTPEVLTRFATRHQISDHWVLLTGKKENIDWVLYKLGAFNEQRDDHYSFLIIGNVATARWLKLPGVSTTSEIVSAVRKIAGTDGGPPV